MSKRSKPVRSSPGSLATGLPGSWGAGARPRRLGHAPLAFRHGRRPRALAAGVLPSGTARDRLAGTSRARGLRSARACPLRRSSRWAKWPACRRSSSPGAPAKRCSPSSSSDRGPCGTGVRSLGRRRRASTRWRHRRSWPRRAGRLAVARLRARRQSGGARRSLRPATARSSTWTSTPSTWSWIRARSRESSTGPARPPATGARTWRAPRRPCSRHPCRRARSNRC